ncbi:LacI family DNA-binding transcriptional regulator [Rubripirellula sp.]|nr:LacI family DNA-binding transcriptional regulator [Rubripirellula sp.]MDB4338792.1 LacI family DNA-binding transcriptional regulator [Rubripirellula sp.]
MKNVTIQDIARVAGVSKSTVSRVLNGTVAVNPEKKKSVLDATKRLGFKPSLIARSLASGRSMTIGVLTQMIGSPFYDAISQGVIAGLGDTGYSPLFADGRWQVQKEADALTALVGRRVDGVVLVGGSMTSEQISEVCMGLPTLTVARRFYDQPIHSIAIDNELGGYQATDCLLRLGHQRIAMIRGIEQHEDARDRFAGYQRAMGEAGVAVDPSLVVDGDFSAESGIRAVGELLSRGCEFSAIFAANDLTAFGARLALDRNGLRVPDDVSLVGFDDQMESAFFVPPLTTIRQPAREMGKQASVAMMNLINGSGFESCLLTSELVVRESTRSVKD